MFAFEENPNEQRTLRTRAHTAGLWSRNFGRGQSTNNADSENPMSWTIKMFSSVVDGVSFSGAEREVRNQVEKTVRVTRPRLL